MVGVAACVVPGCDYKSRHFVKFFGFPKDPVRCRQWTDFCKLRPSKSPPPPSQTICDRHFRDEEDYPVSYRVLKRPKKAWKLNRDAVPSLFPPEGQSDDFLDAVPDDLVEPGVEVDMDFVEIIELEEAEVEAVERAQEPIISHKCRLCFKVPAESVAVVNLFDEHGSQGSLAKDLMIFFQLQFEDSPEWPSIVCGPCVEFIKQMKAFQSQIVTSHTQFYDEIVKSKAEDFDDSPDEPTETGKVAKRPVACPFCARFFPSKEICVAHRRKVHKGMPPDCTVCGKKFPFYRKMQSHFSKTHLPRSHKCTYCGSLFIDGFHLTRHIERMHEVKLRHVCEICGKGFSSKGTLWSHRKDMHSQNKPPDGRNPAKQCELCGLTFVKLGAHMKYSHRRGKTIKQAQNVDEISDET